MLSSVGRLLQTAALVALPVSMVVQLAGGITLKEMLVLMVAGVSAFWLGRIIEGYAGGSSSA